MSANASMILALIVTGGIYILVRRHKRNRRF